MLNDNSHIYAVDADNKAVTIDGIGVTYDAMDRMVEQNRSGAHTQIVYAATGEKFALMSGQTLQKAVVPLPGGGTAVYNNSGLLYFGHSDHLGSIRVGSTPTRTVSFDLAYAPFGETYAPFGSTDTSFTGQRADTSLGLFDFPAREYSNQGRWSTPDPAGLAAASLGFPQSWNRYAYVGNNPLAFIDPLGFGPCDSPYEGLCGGNCADGDIVCSPCDSSFVACVTATTLPPPTPGQCDYVQCGNSGGGSSNGGGGKLAAVVNALKYAADRNRCAANNAGSLAGALGVSRDNFIGQSLLGNDLSAISQLITGPDRGAAAQQVAMSNPTPASAIGVTIKAVMDWTPTNGGGIVLAQNGAGTYYGVKATTSTLGATTVGKVIGGIVSGAAAVKLAADGANYFTALVACSLSPWKQ